MDEDDEKFEWDHPSDNIMMPILLGVVVLVTFIYTGSWT